MCAVCGKDMTRMDFSGHADTARATIPITHNLLGLTVSASEAQKLDKSDVDRLLRARKLTLVLDLDQTVIHATVDPTVGEWMTDPSNPNNESLKDVYTFTLPNDLNTVYYVKPRPHLQHFLQQVRKMYELHIYTMGTRSYADAVAKALDPEGTLFGGRVLSRDESGSFLHKSLSRLFPYEQSMVVVVDDRADVWQWPPNLIRVRPYDFFVGIGDINAHVYEAAKRGEIPASDSPKAKLAPRKPSGAAEGEAGPPKKRGPVEALAQEEAAEDYDTENGEEPPDEALNDQVLAELDKAQKHEIEELVRRRPLAEIAKELEESEGEAVEEPQVTDQQTETLPTTHGRGGLSIDTTLPAVTGAAKPPSPTSPSHRQILKDDDADIPHLLRVLTEIHTRFYELNDQDQLRGSKGRSPKMLKADVREIIPAIKRSVLGASEQGSQVDLLFSSVIPLQTDPTNSPSNMVPTFRTTCTTN
ncbi:HAD-like domain-containing protein [Hyaloraphidium curvatum]|nr:HAD-like domain-containing protein [Hyaloraphidium curvatum]